ALENALPETMGEPASAGLLGLGSWLAFAAGCSEGKSSTNEAVPSETRAKAMNRLPKRKACTIGPNNQTANKFTSNATAKRMPAMRERMRSSTYLTIMASVKGVQPKTKIMAPNKAQNSHPPCASAANISQGICASTITK